MLNSGDDCNSLAIEMQQLAIAEIARETPQQTKSRRTSARYYARTRQRILEYYGLYPGGS